MTRQLVFRTRPTAPAGETKAPDIRPTAGWGPCHSCNCRGFTQTGLKNDICATCSHHWTRHW